ncbi:hypothetical protein protein [Bacillus cereus G9241]|nr:hypothetical protein protein [Bacillus cereus G9241]
MKYTSENSKTRMIVLFMYTIGRRDFPFALFFS